MAQVNKIDSNITGLRYAVEQSLGTLPGSPVWKQLEPNSYNDFGGQLTTVQRRPITDGRQNKKGVVTDLDASGGYNSDLTQTNFQEMLQGFMFADFREKFDTASFNSTAIPITGVTTASDRYAAASGLDSVSVGALLFASGFSNADNNGLKLVDEVDPTYIGVTANLVDEASPPSTARLVEVGYQFAADEVDIDVAGSLPKLVSTLLVAATSTLTFTGNAADGDTVTIGSVVYTFETGALDAPYKVDVGVDASASIDNLVHAIMGTGTPGTHYATGTEAHPLVNAVNGTGDVLDVTAKLAGAQGNTIVVESTGANLDDFDGDGTLLGGVGKNLLDFGLVPGEWVCIGGDGALEKFAAAEDNGLKRVKSVAADGSYIEFDKSFLAMSAEASSGSKTVRLFFGRVLKNEVGTLIKRRSFQFERTLGAPDDAQPTQIQGEYLVGSVASQLQLDLTTADKIAADLSFVCMNNEQRTAVQGLKAGSRPALAEADAFNTSSDVARIKIAKLIAGNEAPTPLFAYATDVGLTINNNLSPNKAISVLGAFDITAGTFQVSGNLEVYFSTVEAVQAVRDNADVTMDMHLVKANAGITIDLPLITLGDGRANIELDQPIKLPLSYDAATAAKYDTNMNHTLLMVFFDYLPDLAG